MLWSGRCFAAAHHAAASGHPPLRAELARTGAADPRAPLTLKIMPLFIGKRTFDTFYSIYNLYGLDKLCIGDFYERESAAITRG
jgi:hypothetical protein